MAWHDAGYGDTAAIGRPGNDPLEDMSLPGWLYYDPEFFEAEKRAFLRAAPQIVCHESEIAEPGEWRTIEYLGESVIVIRGDDGEIRAFSNVCRHRGSRLVDGTGGCSKVLTCPYHAWSYARGTGGWSACRIAQEYPGLQTDKLGLFPVALENWRGFLFVTLEPGAPSVAEIMAPYEEEIEPYRFEELRALQQVTAPAAGAQLEDDRRQLFRPSAHPGRPSRPDPPVRPQLQDRGAGMGRPDGRRFGREGIGQSVRARLPEPSAEGRPSAGDAPAQMALLQAVPERRVRHLPGPGRLHAVPAGQRDDQHASARSATRCPTTAAK